MIQVLPKFFPFQILFSKLSQLFIFFGDFFVGISERSLDEENGVRRRSRKKSVSGNGAREHKDQLHKLQQKVRLVDSVFRKIY